MELFAKYEIVLSLGGSHYFIPSLLPSNLQCSSVLHNDVPINVPTFNVEDTSVGQNLEYEDDDLSDDDNSRDYVDLMVDRASQLSFDGCCSLTESRGSHSADLYVNWKSPVASADTNEQPSTWPDFFNVNLLGSRSFEDATDLFSTYAYKENWSYNSSDNDMDVTSYLALCRIWLSPLISQSFWSRLASRIVSATEITNVLLKLLPTVNFNSVKNTNFSLWSLWQHGIAIIHKDATLVELKHEGHVKRSGEVADHFNKHKIFLSVSTPEFVLYHQKLNIIDANLSLSNEDILSYATKLLVLIEQLVLEINEWFPGTLMEDMFGAVVSFVPCCFCLQKKEIIMQFSSDNEYITIIFDHQRLCCFSFSQILSFYSGGKVVSYNFVLQI